MGWEQLKSIADQNREQALLDEQEPPVACPIDGAILEVAADGHIRSCPLGNYKWE